MAQYFIDASGNSPGGYTNFYNLFSAITLQDGDIIEVVDNGEIDDSATVSWIDITKDNVIVRSYSGNVNRPIIKAPNSPPGGAFLRLRDDGATPPNNVKIQNLRMYKPGPNAGGAMISVDGTEPEDFELSGCEFWVEDTTGATDTRGFSTGGPSSLIRTIIENNDFHDMVFGILWTGGSYSDCRIENNRMYNLDISSGRCFYFNGNSLTDCRIFRNEISTVDVGVLIDGNTVTNLWVENNVIRDTTSIGIDVTPSNTVTQAKIMNNSVRNFDDIGIHVSNGDNTQVENNIVHGVGATTGIDVTSNSNNNIRNNIVYGCTTPLVTAGSGLTISDMIYSDPLFISSTDLRVQQNSPAIDSGLTAGITHVPLVDIRGWSRPFDIDGYVNFADGTDIGAYEMVLASQISGGKDIDIADGDETIVSTVYPFVIEDYASVIADGNFYSGSLWDKVIVEYRHSSGQKLRVVHTLKTGGWIGNGVIAAESNRGDWEKQLIILLDKAGDMLVIKRDEIEVFEDLIITGYYPSSSSSASSESSSSTSVGGGG